MVVGDQFDLGLDVADVGASMQKFDWQDYLSFILMLLICIVVGLYFGFFEKSSNSQDYLMGGRTMKVFPIAMSLIASFISGISLLGIPTEVYVYGVHYAYIMGGFIIMAMVLGSVYLPVFHGLNLTSTYEYHERRFNKKVRLFGSVLFTIGLISWLPLVIYVPALAFNQVTGVNVHVVTPIVCVICIFYTSVGGLKAVVWTDVIQIIIMIGAMFLVALKGTIDIGGIGIVVHRNIQSGRLELPNFDLNPMTRHTIWALVIGGFVNVLQTSAINQNMIQRYLSLPSIEAAKWAIWIFIFGVGLIIGLCSYCGMLIFATFYKCDPLTTMLAREKDQLLPLLVMETLKDIPGLPGVFVAGIFSAALSSLSTGLNSMAAVVLEDFYKPFFSRKLNEKQTYLLMKVTVILFGTFCVGMVFIVEKLGPVLQLSMSIGAISNGASLGIFTMGMLIPWINSTGALSGSISSLAFMTWMGLRAQSLIATGDLTFPEKPVSTDGCHYRFTPKNAPDAGIRLDPMMNQTNIIHTDEKYMIYGLSYLWYTLIGSLVAVIVGIIVSYLTKPLDPRDVEPKLLAPFVRRLIKPRDYPNEPADGLIYAYGPNSNQVPENNQKFQNDVHWENLKIKNPSRDPL